MRHTLFRVLLLWLAALPGAFSDELLLWYDEPAGDWETQALPIGNGRLGAMLFGGVVEDRIQFNEITLWTGDNERMGAYQAFGDVVIRFEGREEVKAGDYRRQLDPETGVHETRFEIDGVGYRTRVFASNPAQAIVAQYESDAPGGLTGRVSLLDSHEAELTVEGGVLVRTGGFGASESKPASAEAFESRLAIEARGGESRVADGELVFENCDRLTLILVAGTSYVLDRERSFKGEHPSERLKEQLAKAREQTFEELLAEHVSDFRSFSDRTRLKLSGTPIDRRSLPTDERIEAYTRQGNDPELEAQLFHYGRYLMQSCSRGILPANLQGLWNNSNTPPWNADYHTNINVQMNYWPSEVANLSECHRVFIDMAAELAPVFREETVSSHDELAIPGGKPPRGWTVRTSHNPFGGQDWKWNKTGNAWYAQHVWEHFAFGRDEVYLREVGYPYMKEVCAFWEDALKELPDGRLVVPDGWSPEHGPVEDGVSYDQQIVWDLFNNTVEALDVLGIEPGYREKLASMRDRLVGPQVGRWGQLMEWMVDRDDPQNTHRHVSHLFGLYPGRQISPTRTPELADAARVSLDARGDAGTSWSMAWKICFWSRLLDGERAHRMLRGMLSVPGYRNTEIGKGGGTETHSNGGTYPNMLSAHPPFQIDGNFGAAAGMCEMLLQSHAGEIHLLPALPSAWADGEATGLRARGGFEVSLKWSSGELISATIVSIAGEPCRVRYGESMIDLDLEPGESVEIAKERFRETNSL